MTPPTGVGNDSLFTVPVASPFRWWRSGHRVVLLGLGPLAVALPALADPLPVETYAALPTAEVARMSFDGNTLGSIGVSHDRLALVLKDLRAAGKQQSFGLGGMSPRELSWKSDKRLLLGVYDEIDIGSNPEASWLSEGAYGRILAVDSDGGNATDITVDTPSHDNIPIQGRIAARLDHDPHHVLLETHGGVFRIDTDTGARFRLFPRQPHITSYIADEDGVPRLGVGFVGTDQVIYARDDDSESFREIHRENFDGTVRFQALAFVPGQPTLIYVIATDPASNKNALWTFDTRTKAFDRMVDGDVAADPRPRVEDSTLISYRGSDLAPKYLDPAWEHDYQAARRVLKGDQVWLMDRARDGGSSLFKITDPQTPTTWWIANRSVSPAQLSPVIETYPSITDAGVAPVKQIRYTARDGLSIPAYVTLPANYKGGQIPFVVLPHDGPGGCDEPVFHYEAQFLASRGWGVLQPEVRGSGCYDLAFQQKGYGQLGYAMQDDVTDGTRWLIDQKLADPAHICMVGSGYGGYAALEEAAREPDLVRCVAAWAPITDLVQERLHIIRNGRPTMHDVRLDRLGDTPDRLSAVSPVRQAERITAPVLLMYGRKDFTVDVRYTVWMTKALQDTGKSVETIYLDDADHFRETYSARLAWLQALDRFLGANLGRPSVETASVTASQ